MKKVIRSRTPKRLLSMMLTLAFVLGIVFPAGATMSPTSLSVTLKPGETVTETKTVNIPGITPKVDVIFSFDLTGSMGGTIDTAKAKAVDIMSTLNSTGADIQYSVVSYMDYPKDYDSYGYAAPYGYPGTDYAYQLDQNLTSDVSKVSQAINGLELGSGQDGPQDYTRIMYESYADPNVGWRAGAKKILVNFGDNVPHDNNINEGIDAASFSTGGDPGRDEIMGNGDDLDLQTVLAKMKINNITMIQCQSGDWGIYTGGREIPLLEYWNYWTGITGGQTYRTDSGNLVANVVTAITSTITTPTVTNLHLVASTGYEGWLEAVEPTSYSGPTGVTVTFSPTIKVPAGTLPGTYAFQISAIDEHEVSFGEQSVTVIVPAAEIPGTFTWLSPLSDSKTADIGMADVLNIGFIKGADLDKSVSIRISNNTTNRLVAGYTYGAGITYDSSTHEYYQNFAPTRYNVTAGTILKVKVYFGGKLAGTALVKIN